MRYTKQVDALSLAQARRIALAAQGFAMRRPAPGARLDRRHVRRVFDRVKVVQIDSVNVLARSHELVLFSRLGPYPRDLLARSAYEHRDLFEYWGHEASFLPMEQQPLFRWRMARGETWGGLARLARERPEFVREVLREVTERGPLSAGELEEPGRKRGPWWGWADGKRALEWLFWTGQVSTATRRNFERVYDLTERVIPREVLGRPTPSEDDACRELLALAAEAHGVATARDLLDYHRLKPRYRPLLDDLVEDGVLVPVRVEGWRDQAYLHRDAARPRRVTARALLSPFDSVVWERSRTERLFGFHFRLEIYVPAPQRVHGYYVLPFLLGDRLVGRVDLKADRKAGALRVQAAHHEPGVDVGHVAVELATELETLAGWLGLDAITVAPSGELAPALGAAVS